LCDVNSGCGGSQELFSKTGLLKQRIALRKKMSCPTGFFGKTDSGNVRMVPS
jgi:hypothetical protein